MISETESAKSAELDTEVLVNQIMDGQKQAEQVLVEHYWRGLYFILSRRSQDPELAADIAQDTFIVVIRKARNGEVKDPSALAAFIRQVGVNLLIAHYRKTTRRDTHTDPDLQIHVPDDSPDLYRKLYCEDTVKLVRQLIEELKETRDREILTQLFIYDKDKVEICATLDLSADNFDKVLYRARRRLKQLIILKLNGAFADSNVSDSLLLVIVFIGANTIPSTLTKNHLEKKLLPQVEETILWRHLDKQVMRGSDPTPLQQQGSQREES